MLDRKDIIEKVQLFIQEIILLGVPIDKAILFGSYAKNTFNLDSDIDLALVSPKFNGFGFEDRKFFSKINIKKEFIAIETKTFPSDYFEMGDPFINEIKECGIVVYESKQ
jgi:predicted nucleotidyltransferase